MVEITICDECRSIEGEKIGKNCNIRHLNKTNCLFEQITIFLRDNRLSLEYTAGECRQAGKQTKTAYQQ